MFSHLTIAALRNLSANRLQSVIAIIGLAVGISTALLIALIIRNQLTFDHFIPGYERTYMAVSQYTQAGRPSTYNDHARPTAAALLKLNAPEVENTTRLLLPAQSLTGNTLATLKQGQVTADEFVYWTDPNAFEVLPLAVFKGDLAKALLQSDGIVLPRTIARKYFGRDDVLGQVILVNTHPMTVRAVIEDLPVNGTSLESGIFASNLASFSPPVATADGVTFVRLKPGASVSALERRLPQLINDPFSAPETSYAMLLVPLDQIPLLEVFHPSAKAKLAVLAIAGTLILLIAAINFVNLLTARAARRALEVGIRKVCGAARRMLVLQFLGESILTVFLASCLGIALSEWLMPAANAFLETGARLDYWQNPLMLGLILTGILALGLLAGAYPAFVLSSFRPSGVLKGALMHSRGADFIRNALVVMQFAVLIGLVVAAAVIYQQNLYATRDGLRGNIDQMLVVQGGCKPALRDQLRKLQGVSGVSCSTAFLDAPSRARMTFKGENVSMNREWLDPGWFALYGIKPLAGSLPPASSAGDYDPNAAPGIILNEAAARHFGFASPQAAIGQVMTATVPVLARANQGTSQNSKPVAPPPAVIPVIAVVPDFTFKSLADQPILPTTYSPSPLNVGIAAISIKLKGQQISETLVSIDQLWGAANPDKPISRFFLDEHMQQLYISILHEAQLFAVCSAVAVFLACLGLFGLSISATERRTKEIGIRKAMGAASSDITRLLLWQFAKPVLCANLIAWPVAFYVMTDWLNGFAYHVALSPLVFVGAALLAVIVALLTVVTQSTFVARAVPATALRYE